MSRRSQRRRIWSARTLSERERREAQAANEARRMAELRKDPPCKNCECPRSEHAGEKCLFGPWVFVAPTEITLKIFMKNGTYRRG